MDITQFYTTFLTIERNQDGSFARVKDGSTGELQKVVRFPEKWSETKSKKTMLELATHFSKWNAAIAIVTGKINNITVIDFDSKDNELIAQLYMESPTLMVETEKGFHLYYKYNGDQSLFQTGTNRFGQKVDCRNDGGLIFAPPTPNYDVFYDEDIAEITEGGIELLKAARGNLPIQSIFDKPRPTETTSRNDTLFRMACGWVESYDDQDVWNRCVSMNKNFKKGELDARELEAVYQQALKYKNRSPKALENVNTHASTNTTQKPIQQSSVDSGATVEQYSWVTMTDVLERASQDLENTDPNDIISFGYKFIDDMITGIFPGDMAVIGGESGSGKTSFATNIIYKASKTKKCAVFALEDRLNDYGIKSIFFDINRQRMLKNLYQYDWNQYRRNEIKTKEYYIELENAKKSLANDNVLFINDVTEMITIESLELMIEQKVNEGVKLFLLDHLHYLDLTRGKQSKSDYIEQVITRLKSVINRTGTSLLLIVHYKKLEGKKPTLDSFKDSISIVQNANYVISLWRDRNALQEGTRCDTTFFIPKARNPNGEGSTMARFNKETNDYEQWDNWQEEVLKKSKENKKQPLRF